MLDRNVEHVFLLEIARLVHKESIMLDLVNSTQNGRIQAFLEGLGCRIGDDGSVRIDVTAELLEEMEGASRHIAHES